MDHSKEIEILILRNFDGVLNHEEKKYLDFWRSKPSNKIVFDQYEQILNISNTLSDWEEFDAFKALEKVKEKIPFNQVRSISKPLLKIAASIAIVITIGLSTFYFNPDIISDLNKSTSNNQRMFLEDGTEVVLSQGSTITQVSGFNQIERRVKLNGEAYFNVIPNKEKSFVIELKETEIEVVGTSFLANSEKNSVFVDEGIVILRDSKYPENTLSLFAGEQASLKAEKLSQIDFRIDWLQKEIKLKDRSVQELLEELKILFPNSLKIDNDGIDNSCRLTSRYTNISLMEVINELDLIFEVKYEKSQNFIRIKSLKCE